MELLTDWIQQVILIIFLAIVAEMLLPSSVWKRYTKIIISLILIMTILYPVLSIFKGDTNKLLSFVTKESKKEEMLLNEKIDDEINEIEKFQSESISQRVSDLMKEKLEDDLASRYKLAIIGICKCQPKS